MNKVKTRQIAADTELLITNKEIAGTFDDGKQYKTISPNNPDGTPKTLNQLLEDIFTERIMPTVTQPKASIVLGTAGSYEVGSSVSPTFTINTDPGSYQYGPATGVQFSFDKAVVKILRNSQLGKDDGTAEQQISGQSSIATGSAMTVTDAMISDPVVAYATGVAYQAATAAPVDNLGKEQSSLSIQAAERSPFTSSAQIKGYRQYFYGADSATSDLTSAIVRALAGKGGANAAKGRSFTIAASSSTKRMIVAAPASHGVTGFKAELTTSMNADISADFVKQTVQVAGAGSAAAVAYDVWVWTPATFQGNEQVKITLS